MSAPPKAGRSAGWPRVLVIGHFSSTGAGGLPSQGELLGTSLAASGARVALLSRKRGRFARLIHTAIHAWFLGWMHDVFLIQVFSRHALLIEWITILAGRFWGRRIVLCMRAGHMPYYLRTYPKLTSCYRLAHQVVFPSEYLKQGCADVGRRGIVIPNFISLDHYHFHARRNLRPKLLFLRTFHPLYNPMLALKVFALVKERYPEAELTMAGMNRNYEEMVRKFAEDANLRDVRFPGFIPKADIPSVMDEHDIYLNTPRIDNMPVTVMEALASGLPVVSVRVGGIPFLLNDGETALLVQSDNPQEMAAAVGRLMEDPGLAETLSVQGRRFIEGFTWEKIRAAWAEALGGPPPSHRRGQE